MGLSCLLLHCHNLNHSHLQVPPPPALCQASESSFVLKWRDSMFHALQPFLDFNDTRYGLFGVECFIHTEFSPQSPTLEGHNYLQVRVVLFKDNTEKYWHTFTIIFFLLFFHCLCCQYASFFRHLGTGFISVLHQRNINVLIFVPNFIVIQHVLIHVDGNEVPTNTSCSTHVDMGELS